MTKADLEQEIIDLKKKLEAKPKYSNIVEGCEFNAVKWDASSLETVNLVAKALYNSISTVDNAIAGLNNLTDLFTTQDIEMECMLKVQGENDVAIANNVVKGESGDDAPAFFNFSGQ